MSTRSLVHYLKNYDTETSLIELFDENMRGWIFTQEGRKWPLAPLIRHYQKSRGFREWTATHTGIIGYDGFVWEMTAGGLKYNYIIPRIMDGTRVKLWRPECLYRPEDARKAIKDIKQLFATKLRYDFLELLTAGLIDPRKRLVCSTLVRRYLALINTRKPVPRLLWPNAFFAPAQVALFCKQVYQIDMHNSPVVKGIKPMKGGEST